MSDDNPRPIKRQRIQSSQPSSPPPSLPALEPLPPAVLLVSLPALLAQPPTHRAYLHSLQLSLFALRKCLTLSALPPEIECRAWTGLAEIGMRIVGGGLTQNADHPWAKDIETEIDKAITKGAIIAQKHPSLRAYRHHLVLLQARMSHWQHKSKFARTQLRNLVTSLQPSDPPHIVYATYLAIISLLVSPRNSAPPATNTSSGHTKQDIHTALATIQELEERAAHNMHKQVVLLAHALRLRIRVAAGMWDDVASALLQAEGALGLSYTPSTTPKHGKTKAELGRAESAFIFFDDAFESAIAVHTLMMAVVYYTHMGFSAEASPRLSHLHALLDSGAVDTFPNGTVEIKFATGPPLTLEVTHPRILFLLAFLVSAAAKRDAVGRRPKRKVFATEGLAIWEKEVSRELSFSAWAGLGDVEEAEQRLARIKADLLCELAAVSIMRSEFDIAEKNLALLIAHTRIYNIFDLFAARISLHHAHLAHALGQCSRALDCYRVAAHLSEKGSFVDVTARAGELALTIGLTRDANQLTLGVDKEGLSLARTNGIDVEAGVRLTYMCKGHGGTLEAVGQIIRAVLSNEILRAKQHLKQALNLASTAQDNHLRALILALISSHYFHTAGDHALSTLQTCEQLAAGLGAPPTKPGEGEKSGRLPVTVGNAPLGLWVGERFLELFKRAGKEDRAQRQMTINATLMKAVEELKQRSALPLLQ